MRACVRACVITIALKTRDMYLKILRAQFRVLFFIFLACFLRFTKFYTGYKFPSTKFQSPLNSTGHCIPIRHCSHIMGRFLGLTLAGIYYHNNKGSGENAIAHLISDVPMIRPQGYKTFFMLNSTVHDILTAHKN